MNKLHIKDNEFHITVGHDSFHFSCQPVLANSYNKLVSLDGRKKGKYGRSYMPTAEQITNLIYSIFTNEDFAETRNSLTNLLEESHLFLGEALLTPARIYIASDKFKIPDDEYTRLLPFCKRRKDIISYLEADIADGGKMDKYEIRQDAEHVLKCVPESAYSGKKTFGSNGLVRACVGNEGIPQMRKIAKAVNENGYSIEIPELSTDKVYEPKVICLSIGENNQLIFGLIDEHSKLFTYPLIKDGISF